MTKEEIKAEIKRLQELLDKMEEEEKLDFPHKQNSQRWLVKNFQPLLTGLT